MLTRVISNTPLRPIVKEMRALAGKSQEFWAASAFVTSKAASDVLGSAIDAGARVRFLTGTFGNNTRRSTFENLLDLQQQGKTDVQIWDCGRHRNFHAKLYLWHLKDGNGVAWIGSANLTDGGLQENGELLLEVRAPWGSPTLKRLRNAFNVEWKKGNAITDDFVRTYKEAPRQPPDAKVVAPHGGAPGRVMRSKIFTTTATKHIKEGTPTYNRVEELLQGTADRWYRGPSRQLRKVRVGHHCIFVDIKAREIALVEVTDVVKDGKYTVFAYEPVLSQNAWKVWDKSMRVRAINAGLRCRGRGTDTAWLAPEVSKAFIKDMYPGRKIFSE